MKAECCCRMHSTRDVRPAIQEWRDSKGLPEDPHGGVPPKRISRNASRKSGRQATRRTSHPMPDANSTQALLAFDFGAESGRAVLAHLHSGVLTHEEVHRFPNEPVEYGGSLHWDVARLWFEIRKALSGLKESRTGRHRSGCVGCGLRITW